MNVFVMIFYNQNIRFADSFIFKTFILKTVIIDNYDSFTYNLYHYVEQFDSEVVVVRNDEFKIEELDSYGRIILSPGPGLPIQAGLLIDVIKTYYATKRILGICLGHQAIIEAFGGQLQNLQQVLHGRQIKTHLNTDFYVFSNLPSSVFTGRYHSFVGSRAYFPAELEIVATDESESIQGVCHRKFDVTGLQFHPESVLTEYGFEMIKNWMENKQNPRNL